jgi:hypothetical protein
MLEKSSRAISLSGGRIIKTARKYSANREIRQTRFGHPIEIRLVRTADADFLASCLPNFSHDKSEETGWCAHAARRIGTVGQNPRRILRGYHNRASANAGAGRDGKKPRGTIPRSLERHLSSRNSRSPRTQAPAYLNSPTGLSE